MKKLTLLATFVVATFLMLSAANAFSIKMENHTGTDYNYTIQWNECDWEGFPKDANMAGGLLRDGAERSIDHNYKGGKWTIFWSVVGEKGQSRFWKINVPQIGILILKAGQAPDFLPGV
jgi:hypothetical protein